MPDEMTHSNPAPIYIINLDRAEDRWAQINAQLQALDINNTVSRFGAIDGKAEPHPLFDRYNDTLSRRWKGYSLSYGQLGCFASHYLIWEECCHLGKPIIVLEDDAIIDPDTFGSFLQHASTLPNSYECVRLFQNHSKHHRRYVVDSLGALSLVKYTKGPMSTTGYYLTPDGAKKLLSANSEWFLPVDISMDRFWQNKVECFGIDPPPVSNSPEMESTIGYSRTKNYSGVSTKVFREVFAAEEHIRKFLHNLRFLIRLYRKRAP